MVQSNFINSTHHTTNRSLQADIILNADIIADMAASPNFATKHLSSSEIDLGAGYSIRSEGDQKIFTRTASSAKQTQILSAIFQFRGDHRTSSIGLAISEKYGVYMSSERSFQSYKRVFEDSGSDE